MEKIRIIFAAPIFKDEEKNRNAYLLNFITIAYFFISILSVFGALFATTHMHETMRELLVRTLPLLVVLTITQFLMRLGRVRTASFFLGILLWLTITIDLFTTEGLTSSSLSFYILVVMVFGLLLGRKYAIIIAIFSFIAAIMALALEGQGLLPPQIRETSSLTELFTFFIILFLTTSLLYLYRMRFDKSVEKLKHTNFALELVKEQMGNHLQALKLSNEVSRRISTIMNQEELVREVIEQLHLALDYHHIQIYFYDEFKQNLVMEGGTGDAGRTMLANSHKIEFGQGLVGQAAEKNQVVMIPDVTKTDDWLPNPLLPETRAELAVPITIGKDVLGVLDVQHNIANALTEADMELIQAIANQVAIAVQNAKTYTRSRRQAVREAQIAAISQRIQSAMTIEDVLQIAVSELGNTLGARNSNIDLQVTAISLNERN